MEPQRRIIRRNDPTPRQAAKPASEPLVVPAACPMPDETVAAAQPTPGEVIAAQHIEVKPTSATSSNRYLPREVQPRRDLIRFASTDRKVSNKKRKASLNRGGMHFQDRDRDVLRLVVAYGWLSKKQIAALLGCSVGSLQRRLRQLSAFGLLNDKSRGFGSEILYSPTKLTLKHSGMGTAEGFRLSRPSAQTISHTEGLVACALRFQENPSNGTVVTEREISAAVQSGILSQRVQSLASWAQAKFANTFKTWILDAGTVAGHANGGHKRPDMLLITKDQPPTAIEFEITKKTTVDAYRRTLASYDDAVVAGHIASPIYYVTAEVCGTSAAIHTALNSALKILNESRKTTVRFQVAVLDAKRWNPTAAQSGWFHGGKQTSR